MPFLSIDPIFAKFFTLFPGQTNWIQGPMKTSCFWGAMLWECSLNFHYGVVPAKFYKCKCANLSPTALHYYNMLCTDTCAGLIIVALTNPELTSVSFSSRLWNHWSSSLYVDTLSWFLSFSLFRCICVAMYLLFFVCIMFLLSTVLWSFYLWMCEIKLWFVVMHKINQ